jgi:hypothetical protein
MGMLRLVIIQTFRAIQGSDQTGITRPEPILMFRAIRNSGLTDKTLAVETLTRSRAIEIKDPIICNRAGKEVMVTGSPNTNDKKEKIVKKIDSLLGEKLL